MLTICYLRRGHKHDYGSAEFNLNEEIYAKLSPGVQRVFGREARSYY
jgi:hypothetical protein